MYTSGLILLVMGMGMTFLFLYVMIIITNLSAKYASKLSKFVPDPEPKKTVKPTAAKSAADDDAVIAAIAAAMVKANA